MRQYEADTWYDANGRIVFTASKGLPGVGLPRKAIRGDTSYVVDGPTRQETKIALGWEDVRDLEAGTIRRRATDNTQPGGADSAPHRVRRSIHAPRTGGRLSKRLASIHRQNEVCDLTPVYGWMPQVPAESPRQGTALH